MTNKKGFTLIELLVVIAIIGILSAIGLVSLNGAREKARDSKARSDLAIVRTGLTLYFDDHDSSYPGEAVQDTADVSKDGAASPSTATGVWLDTGPLVTEYFGDLKSPFAGRTYGYITSSTASNTAASPHSANHYAVFYNLEGSGGLYYYSVDDQGSVHDTKDADQSAPTCGNDAVCSL